jgi:anti-anti-sigma factor
MDELVQVEIAERDEVVVARVTGELDIAGATGTGAEIAAAVPTSARGLVVDFSGLEFIDSSGVAMLFSLARQLSSRRQHLRVVAPAGQPVSRVLEIVEFERAAPIHSDVDAAVSDIPA